MIGITRYIIRSKSTYKYSPLNECINIVKTRDYENYLCCLLINNTSLMRFAIALRSLNTELASVKDVAKNRDVAQFRFQFWNETCEKLFRSDYYPPVNEPITHELKQVSCFLLGLNSFQNILNLNKIVCLFLHFD